MSMKRSPEWYAEYQRKMELHKVKAIGSTSGGAHAARDAKRAGNVAGSPSGLTAADAPAGDCQPTGQSGSLTSLSNIEFIAGGPPRKNGQAASWPAPSAPAPIYPVVGLCRAAGLPEPIPEYQFHPKRRWRFDYAWPAHKLAMEVDGGIWSGGRHVTGVGRLGDMEKQSEAAILGYRILYVTPEQVRDGVALDYIQRALRPLEFVA